MVKHTETIRPQKPTNCLSVFDHFVGLALKGLRSRKLIKNASTKIVYYVMNNYIKRNRQAQKKTETKMS